jgi:SulP family sulfate permease
MSKQHSLWPRITLMQGLLPLKRKELPSEILAGLTLAALAIPEVMGYTKIAGTPLVTGLYTMLLPMLLFAFFGSSRHLVVGADSATAAILAAALVGMATVGSAEYLALACALALMAAVLLLLARVVGLGFMADFLSRTVLVGFLTGVGIQVSLGQLPGMLGLHISGHGTLEKLALILEQSQQINGYALAMALAVVLLVALCKRRSRRFPGALLAVIGSILLSWALGFAEHMPLLGEVPRGLPQLGLPQVAWSLDLISRLMPTALAMFVVILTQSAATSRAYAARYGESFNEDTDLIGLSMANIGAACSGTFVVNGSPTKTQMVDSAGGSSQLAMLVTALVVLLVLLFFTAPLAYLPETVLAAVVFMIGLELIDIAGLKRIYQQRPTEFAVALITLFMVVLVGVKEGILLAMVLSVIDHLRRGYRPKNVLIADTKSDGLHAEVLRKGAQARPGLMIYRFTHSMYFANSRQLSEEVIALSKKTQPPLRWFCIDCSAVDDVDYSAAEVLRSLRLMLANKGVRLVFAQVMPDISARVRDDIGHEGEFFGSIEDVLKAYDQLVAETMQQS